MNNYVISTRIPYGDDCIVYYITDEDEPAGNWHWTAESAEACHFISEEEARLVFIKRPDLKAFQDRITFLYM